jgi:hypothetical protein
MEKHNSPPQRGSLSPIIRSKLVNRKQVPGNRAALADTRRLGPTNAAWWPNQLNLKILHQHSPCPIPWTRSSITPRNSRASTWMP